MRNGTLAIVIGGLVCTIITGIQLGPLAASGMALGAALILAFRSNAAKAGLRALRYARLEKQIKHGLERYGLPSPADGALDAPGRVAGLSFDQDVRRLGGGDPDWPPQVSAVGRREGERRRGSTGQLFEVRGQQWQRVDAPAQRRRVESLPLAERLRDKTKPTFSRDHLGTFQPRGPGDGLPDRQGEYPLGDSDPRNIKGD